MDNTVIIGNIAALLTTVSFLPQAIKTIKTKNTGGLSFPMYLLFVTGVTLWLVYGLLNKQTPIIVGNAITLVLSGIILGFMVKGFFIKKSKNDLRQPIINWLLRRR